VGVDIDYAELGGTRGMIMVCMTGTAVKVANLKEIADIDFESLEDTLEISSQIKRINHLLNKANV
jgi:hypothetical protein